MDPFFVSGGLPDGGPHHDARILHGMVVVYVQIAVHPDAQIKKAMSGKTVQHMIKKSDSRFNVRIPAAVGSKFKFDFCFLCIPFY